MKYYYAGPKILSCLQTSMPNQQHACHTHYPRHPNTMQRASTPYQKKILHTYKNNDRPALFLHTCIRIPVAAIVNCPSLPLHPRTNSSSHGQSKSQTLQRGMS